MAFFSNSVAFATIVSSSLIFCATIVTTMAATVPAQGMNELSSVVPSSSYATSQYEALAKVLPGKVSLPPDPTYLRSKRSYFSQQEEELVPGCVVTPLNSNDVATLSRLWLPFMDSATVQPNSL